MSRDPLAIYLEDHLAGSVAALRLMEELAELEPGTALESKLRGLHAEVSEEQQGLRALLARIDASPSALKQAAAWISEKVGEGKLAIVGRNHPALARLQGLESLVLGLQGKLGLYRVLGDLAAGDRRLDGDYAGLAERTVAQQAMVEAERRAAGREAFAAPSGRAAR
jgi:hypothetical protein